MPLSPQVTRLCDPGEQLFPSRRESLLLHCLAGGAGMSSREVDRRCYPEEA